MSRIQGALKKDYIIKQAKFIMEKKNKKHKLCRGIKFGTYWHLKTSITYLRKVEYFPK